MYTNKYPYNLKDQYNTTFVMDWGAFIWKVMPFGVKKYQIIVTKAFKEYLDQFMKTFLDNFILYINMETHI
jgi:hypothetical protein